MTMESRVQWNRYTDFDDGSMGANGTTFDFYKLDPTLFHRESYGLFSRDLILTRSRDRYALSIEESNPSELPTFARLMNPLSQMWWHGKLIRGDLVQRDEAMPSCGIAAQTLMLAA